MPDMKHILTPRSGFVVTVPSADTMHVDSWRLLYQPLLGVAAFGLYTGLGAFASEHPQLSNRRLHSELLTWLRLDLSDLQDARKRLEATGLLSTYFQQDALGDVYVYLVHAPLNARDFFADDLLSVTLLQSVGQNRYDQLLSYFEQSTVDVSKMENVSADFLSVYHMSDAQLSNRPGQLTAVQDDATAQSSEVSTNVDFKLLSDYLKREFVDIDSVVAKRDLISAEATLYGLNERELSDLIVKATSVTNNQFNADRFKQQVAAAFQAAQVTGSDDQLAESSMGTGADSNGKPVTSTGDAQDQGQVKALVAAVKAYAPADFLASLKREKNQYVTDGEQRVLSSFMQRNLFAPSVVNMLIYYLIGDRDQNVLYQNNVDRVANDWSKAKVQTPEQAVDHMREFAQAQETRRQQRQTGKSTKSREKLPDWNQQPTPESSNANPVDNANEIEKLRNRLAQAKQNQEDK